MAFFAYASGDRFGGIIPQLAYDIGNWTAWLCEKDPKFEVTNFVTVLHRISSTLPLPTVDIEQWG